MKGFVLFVSLMVAFQMHGQEGFYLNPDRIDTTFTPEKEAAAYGEICNNGSESISLYWKINALKANPEWQYYICDNNLCYGPFIHECPEGNPVILSPGECGPLEFHMFKTDIVECGMFEIEVWEKDNPDNRSKMEINFNCAPSSSSDFSHLDDLVIYPNPTQEYFELDGKTSLSYLTVNNILGIEMLRYSMREERKYRVERLPQGIYMVNLFGSNGDLLKSLRMKKI